MTTLDAMKIYDEMTDSEITDIVIAKRPLAEWWLKRCPRSVIFREIVLAEIRRRANEPTPPQTRAVMTGNARSVTTPQPSLF